MSAQPALYETDRACIVRDFFDALRDFSSGGWYGGNYGQDGRTMPHLLLVNCNYQDRYMRALFFGASTLLEKAHEDSGAHRRHSWLTLAIELHAGLDSKKPASQWSSLFPEVEQIISEHGAETRAAFDTVFDTCRKYQRAAEAIPVTSQGRVFTRENCGITQDQANNLYQALLTIWAAYPETDPRISEGFDMAMSDQVARNTFTFKPSIGGVSGYSFESSGSSNASDYRLLDMLDTYDGRVFTRQDHFPGSMAIEPMELAQIATQTIENYTLLQPFAPQIAERCLAKFLGAVLKIESGSENATAKQILEKMASGETTPKAEKDAICHKKYGNRAGESSWGMRDDRRQKADYILLGHGQAYLQLCADIHSGRWFENQRDKIAALCAQKNLPGFGAAAITASPVPTLGQG